MKIRNGFVSNSSTSSFLIYGILLDEDEIKKALNIQDGDGEDEDGYGDDIYEMLEDVFKKEKIQGYGWHNPYDDDGWYIGKSWGSVKNDETGKQLKDTIEKDLKLLFGKKVKCLTHSEAWRDG